MDKSTKTPPVTDPLRFELSSCQTEQLLAWFADIQNRYAQAGTPLEQVTVAFTVTPTGTQILADAEYPLRCYSGCHEPPTEAQALLQWIDDEGFALTSLSPAETGLDITIYVACGQETGQRSRIYVGSDPQEVLIPMSLEDEPKILHWELAALFVRLLRGLDAITGGDDGSAEAWLRNFNTDLHSVPAARIQSVKGLVETVSYVDARRAGV